MKKQRIDTILVEKGFVQSRAKAQALIMAGQIFTDKFFSKKVTKPSELFSNDTEIFIKEKLPFVSRGGLKLQEAINKFNINLKNLTVLDVGASTGGFTDCALKQGAKKIYSLDVGKSLIDLTLRKHEKVILIENCNFRYVDTSIYKDVDFITIDVSFISLSLILPNAYNILKPDGQLVALIKPQFEVSKKDLKKGIVKDEFIRTQAKEKITSFAIKTGFKHIGTTESPIKGGKGNIEYLIYLKK